MEVIHLVRITASLPGRRVPVSLTSVDVFQGCLTHKVHKPPL